MSPDEIAGSLNTPLGADTTNICQLSFVCWVCIFSQQVKRLEEQPSTPVTTQSLLEKDSAVFNHSKSSNKTKQAPSTVSKPPEDENDVASPSSPRSPQRASRKRSGPVLDGNPKRRKDDGLNSNSNNGNRHAVTGESPLKRFGQWIKDKVSTP